jgi:sugar phosphate isomerase/epimerase
VSVSDPIRNVRAEDRSHTRPMVAFSKAFQNLNYDETAALVAEVGWDGIECPVRQGGQVLPERVEDDLPRLVEAMKKCGVSIQIITTDIRGPRDALTEKVLRTAARLGIGHYRMAHIRYRKDQPIPQQLREHKPAFRDLAALNREVGICGGYQNHSGSDYLGGAVWDIYELIQDLDPKCLGIHFDIGHATVEGGMIWPVHAQLMRPFFSAVYVKDFIWAQTGSKWQVKWCPLGEGMVQRSFFDSLKASGYAGPISQHHEYPLGNKTEMTAAFKADLKALQRWLPA